MVATQSCMLPIGTIAPRFSLEDVTSKEIVELKSGDKSKGYLVAFICNHCPYVIHLLNHLPIEFNRLQENGLKFLQFPQMILRTTHRIRLEQCSN